MEFEFKKKKNKQIIIILDRPKKMIQFFMAIDLSWILLIF